MPSPTDVVTVPTRLAVGLSEASAAARSPARPGWIISLNDSGHDPVLYAIDTTGTAQRQWPVADAVNIDWEALAYGPCAAEDATPVRCLYVGDVGDNDAVHPTRTLYRVADPGGVPDSVATLRAERLEFVYADGPHDVEAMFVTDSGTTYLITKRPLRDRAGRFRPALVFALPAAAWHRPDVLATAQLVDSLPLVPTKVVRHQITDASLATDHRVLAVRTYGELYLFAVEPLSGRIRHEVPPTACDLSPLSERQGEAITWLDAHGRFLAMSEGEKEPLQLFDCSVPTVPQAAGHRPGAIPPRASEARGRASRSVARAAAPLRVQTRRRPRQ